MFKAVILAVLILVGVYVNHSNQQLRLAIEKLQVELIFEGDTLSPYECSLLELPDDCGEQIRPPAGRQLTDTDRAVIAAFEGIDI